MKAPRDSRRRLWAYWAVVASFVVILGWWIVFFSMQGRAMLEKLEERGVGLSPEQAAAVRDVVDGTARMLLFEGLFLVLLLVVGLLLVMRALRDEVLLHRQRRDFLSAVTHELKSPIASAQLYTESLILGRVPEEKREHYLGRVKEELGRLGKMAEHLLDTARATSGLATMELEDIELGEFSRELMQRFVDAEAGPVRIDFEVEPPVVARADHKALEAILRNLFSNAMKYGGESPWITVSVRDRRNQALLRVRDHGSGMAEEDAAKLFAPFLRGGNELVRNRPGVGLGLFLVAELARAQGGEVRAGNVDDGEGFAVDVTLPIAPAEVST